MSLKKNVVANYLGHGWQALMGIAFVPVYIKYLGIEAYGLIGIFALLQIWLSLLDVGMTPVLSREMARFTGGAHDAQSIRDLLRSIEMIGMNIAVLIAILIWGTSDWLASDWLKTEKIPLNTVSQAFSIMGTITAFRFVENIYRSSIVGLQKQVTLNIINSIMSTLKGLGAVGILVFVSPTIMAFFLWQGILSVLTIGIFAYIVYHTLPKSALAGRFSISVLQKVWRYAGGMLAITFLSILLTQVDKILLSKLLTLEEFGYYSLAALVASGLFMLVSPISQAFFPRFSQLVALQDQTKLIRDFHKSAQMVAVIMGSSAIILIFFAQPILYLWTQDTSLAQRSAPLVIPLVLGNLLNGLMWIPYQTQLAYGWTSLTIKINIFSVIIIIPAILWLTPLYGAQGAAWVWVALNVGYVLIGIHFMYRRILCREKWRWYIQDVFLPLTVAVCSACLFVWITPSTMSNLAHVAWLIVVSIVVFISSVIAAPELRTQIYTLASHKWSV